MIALFQQIRSYHIIKWDQVKEREKNAQMQFIAAVAEGKWLDSWPGTVLEGVADKVDIIAAYGMLNGACENEDEGDRMLDM